MSTLQRQITNDEGEKIWQDVGQIQDNGQIQSQTPCSETTTDKDTDEANKNADTTTNTPIAPPINNTKPLPMHVKHLLSPNAKIKSDRKANFLYRHSHDKIDTNLLIFLHGAGDSHTNYRNLSKQMNLPQCASLCLHASCMDGGFVTLPFGLGHSWFEEMDYGKGMPLDRNHDERWIESLEKGVCQLNTIINALILSPTSNNQEEEVDESEEQEEEEGWLPERIFLFGFSAGACLAMQTCLHRLQTNQPAIGGAICIGGGCTPCTTPTTNPTSEHDNDDSANSTSNSTSTTSGAGCNDTSHSAVLVITGSHDEYFTVPIAQKACYTYNNHCSKTRRTSSRSICGGARLHVQVGKSEHKMIDSEEEMRNVMEFCAEHMVRRMVAMEEGCIEISS